MSIMESDSLHDAKQKAEPVLKLCLYRSSNAYFVLLQIILDKRSQKFSLFL